MKKRGKWSHPSSRLLRHRTDVSPDNFIGRPIDSSRAAAGSCSRSLPRPLINIVKTKLATVNFRPQFVPITKCSASSAAAASELQPFRICVPFSFPCQKMKLFPSDNETIRVNIEILTRSFTFKWKLLFLAEIAATIRAPIWNVKKAREMMMRPSLKFHSIIMNCLIAVGGVATHRIFFVNLLSSSSNFNEWKTQDILLTHLGSAGRRTFPTGASTTCGHQSWNTFSFCSWIN